MVDVDFGTDINSLWTNNPQGDLLIISDEENAKQAIYNRLMTKLDELLLFGYTDYGNQSHEVIGSTDFETSNQLIKIYTENCLLTEPRVEKILDIIVDFTGSGATVNITYKLIGEDKGTNLVLKIGDEA